MRIVTGMVVVALGLCVSACGGLEADDASFDDGLGVSEDAVAINFAYDCSGYGASVGQKLGLALVATHATVQRGSVTAKGTYDANYRPPSGSTDVRYKSFTGWTGAPATPTLLVSKSLRTGGTALRTGGKGGFLTVRYGSGTRATQETFICRIRAATGPATQTPEVPIPYVLQWINDYRGTGSVSRLNLKRDGTYEATVARASETGVFFGPHAIPSGPIALRLVAANGTVWSASLTMYSSTSANVSRDGTTGTLNATLPTDGEDACDGGGGSYLDDDANSEGLYCACPDGQSWIPSQGGCVR